MNAAAKSIGQVNFWGGSLHTFSVRREIWGLLLVVSMVLLSAIATIYSKNSGRQLNSELQIAKKQQEKLQIEWHQLLIEQSTWATAERIQSIAKNRLVMHLPSPGKSIFAHTT